MYQGRKPVRCIACKSQPTHVQEGANAQFGFSPQVFSLEGLELHELN